MPVETEQQRASYIRAIIRERDSYRQKGDEERAETCEQELRSLGVLSEKPQARAERRPTLSSREQRNASGNSPTPSPESQTATTTAKDAERTPPTPQGSDSPEPARTADSRS